ncbi:MAG TPA: hypothetical protein VMS31_15975 [Pyrinomonadaceae bacterium]|nr:hypothetical protein [Pyrinomonadaceae bacterium]
MKLCPQCEFLYEDDQIYCDMDGEGLVHDTRTEVFTASVPTAANAGPNNPRRRYLVVAAAAGLLLSLLITATYIVSSRSLQSSLGSDRGTEANLSEKSPAAPVANSSAHLSANPSQSPTSLKVTSEAPAAAAVELTNNARSATERPPSVPKAENTQRTVDSRLTIPRRVPSLPHLEPIPRLRPPQRLAVGTPSANVAVTTESGKHNVMNQKVTETSQKSLIVEVKPASKKPAKPSRVRSFFKKTGRLLKKPFQL